MAKTNINIYRIKDLESGLYYTGGLYGPYKNPDYESDPEERRKIEYNIEKSWSFAKKKEENYWSGKWPWNMYYKPRWNEIGKIFTSLKGAEKALSELTGVSVHTRKEKAKNILFGNKKSNNYVIVPCRVLDKVIKLNKEK
jgi:hypothetical protein